MLLTKELKLHSTPTGRKIRVSSNLIRQFGFVPGTRLGVEQCTTRTLVLAPQVDGPWLVHQRNYSRRPKVKEAVVEFSSQNLIRTLMPPGWDRIHFTFEDGRMTLKGVAPQLFSVRRSFREEENMAAFMALSSGLDAEVFAQAGFHVSAALDYRPQEARDTTDLTESGLQTFLANRRPQLVFNEDLTTCDPQIIAALTQSRIGTVAVLSVGLQCDDFSHSKSPSLKRLEMSQFRPSSRELGYYATKLIEALKPAAVFIENVPNWYGSEAQAILGAVLSRMGYEVKSEILNSADFGALTTRRRCYLIASAFPGFTFPEPTGSNTIPLRNLVNPTGFRDVSHTKAAQEALTSKYGRVSTLDKTTAGTILKSQARQAKDSLYFREHGVLLLPKIETLRLLQGIPPQFDLSQVGDEVAVEQIGQGVDFPLHRAVADQLMRHLAANRPQFTGN